MVIRYRSKSFLLFILVISVLILFFISNFVNATWHFEVRSPPKKFYFNPSQDVSNFFVSSTCGKGFYLEGNPSYFNSSKGEYFINIFCNDTVNKLYVLLFFFQNDEDAILWSSSADPTNPNPFVLFNKTNYWGYQVGAKKSEFGSSKVHLKIKDNYCKIDEIKVVQMPNKYNGYVLKVKLTPNFNTYSAINYFIKEFGTNEQFREALKHYYFMKTLVFVVIYHKSDESSCENDLESDGFPSFFAEPICDLKEWWDDLFGGSDDDSFQKTIAVLPDKVETYGSYFEKYKKAYPNFNIGSFLSTSNEFKQLLKKGENGKTSLENKNNIILYKLARNFFNFPSTSLSFYGLGGLNSALYGSEGLEKYLNPFSFLYYKGKRLKDYYKGVNNLAFSYFPFVLLAPNGTMPLQNTVTFNLKKFLKDWKGAYQLFIYAIPIDGKCANLTRLMGSPLWNLNVRLTEKVLSSSTYNLGEVFNKVYYNKSSGHFEFVTINNIFDIGKLNKLGNKNIKFYNLEGNKWKNIKNQSVDPLNLSILINNVLQTNKPSVAKKFLNKTYELMFKNFSISVFVNNTDPTKTNVTISVKELSPVKGFAIYNILPKLEVPNISYIKSVSNKGKFFIVDGEPVIGWYFNNSLSGGINLSYTTNTSTTGGTIVITQVPILYNENQLIINYRQTGCLPGEVELFQLDDLTDSNVYSLGSGTHLYHVCISARNYTLGSENEYNLNLNIFNYTDGGNASYDKLPGFTSSVGVSTQRIDPKLVFKSVISPVQPSINFSCLGSVQNLENSKFGDCSF